MDGCMCACSSAEWEDVFCCHSPSLPLSLLPFISPLVLSPSLPLWSQVVISNDSLCGQQQSAAFYITPNHSRNRFNILTLNNYSTAHICSFAGKASLADPRGNTLWLHFLHTSGKGRKKSKQPSVSRFNWRLREHDSPWCSLSLQDSGTNIPPRPLRHQLWIGWKEVERGLRDHQGQCQSGAATCAQQNTIRETCQSISIWRVYEEHGAGNDRFLDQIKARSSENVF